MGANYKRQFIVSFAIMLVGVLVSAGIFYFLVGNINAVTNEIVKDKALSDEQSGALAGVAMLRREAPEAAIYQAAMNNLLPTQDGLIGFSQWITDAAGRHQVSATITFQGGTQGASMGSGEMGFSLTASGNLNDLVSFLDDIETKSPGFLIQLGSFTLTGSNSNYQLSSQGNVFFQE